MEAITNISQTPSPRIAVDPHAHGMDFILLEDSVEKSERNLLRLPFLRKGRPHGSTRLFGSMESCISALCFAVPKSNAGMSVLVGSSQDPFLPFEKRLARTLDLLEMLSTLPNCKIYLQTRSPLVITAMPLLRRMGQNITVSVFVETVLDSWSRRVFPGMPIPSERFQTARTLHERGIPCILSATPLIPKRAPQKVLRHFGIAVAQAGCRVHIHSVDQALRELRAASPNSHLDLEHYFQKNADLALHHELRRWHPGVSILEEISTTEERPEGYRHTETKNAVAA